MASSREKRKFSRMEFGAPCELFCEEQVWSSEVLDLSFGGVMVRRPQGELLPFNKPFEIVIHVDEHTTAIVMAVELRHVDEERLGFRCDYIDADSIENLEQLVASKLGDLALLERDFAKLIG
ncbi:MAG TPA: PilZ domain-containing protein [Marinobacter sp.]|nr:PilZ domain-containing protein [Marinobacter sp.]